jgi:hypothetical protein
VFDSNGDYLGPTPNDAGANDAAGSDVTNNADFVDYTPYVPYQPYIPGGGSYEQGGQDNYFDYEAPPAYDANDYIDVGSEWRMNPDTDNYEYFTF